MMNWKKTIKSLEKNYDKKKIVKVSNSKSAFLSPENTKRTMYKVFTKSFSPINLSLTVLNPGKVNGEFYMTRGHIHKKSSPEFYILLSGRGKLLLQKNNKTKTINLKKREITLVPENFAHKLINTGKEKLKVLTIYHENARPDYKVKFRKRFLA